MTETYRPADRIAPIQPSVIRQFFDRGKGCINLGLGEPDFFTPRSIRDRAIEVLQTKKLPYTPNFGLWDLREKIAKQYSGATADNVLITAGSQEALFAVVLAFVNPGDEVLVSDPAFLAYPTLVQIASGVLSSYPMPAPRFAPDLKALQAKGSAKTRMLLVNTPSNPTGQILSRDQLQAMSELALKHQWLLVSDEIYQEVYFSQRPPSLWEISQEHIVISGFSKTYSMTGWRLGWIVGPEIALRRINLIHAYSVTCASTLSQRAALAAFTDEGDKEREDLRRQLEQRRDLMALLLQSQVGLPFVEPQGSFYFLLDISRFGNSMEVAERLLQAGVITIPGAAFGKNCEGYLRLSCSASEEDIEAGIAVIARTLRSE
jgi:aspartate/methionine/tyrosine aminotransferase